MIKAVAGDLLIFGLSDMNIAMLKDGRLIYFDLKEIGIDQKVCIFHGATEDEMKGQLLKYFQMPN